MVFCRVKDFLARRRSVNPAQARRTCRPSALLPSHCRNCHALNRLSHTIPRVVRQAKHATCRSRH